MILNLATLKIMTLALRMMYLTSIIRNSNMMLFLEKTISVSCFPHTLQLVAKFDDVKPYKEVISTRKRLVARFNKSVKATEMLVKLSRKKLIGDCPT